MTENNGRASTHPSVIRNHHEFRDPDKLDSNIAAEFKCQLHQPRAWCVNLQNGLPARVTGLDAQALQLLTGIQQIWHIGLVESHVLNAEDSKTSECVGVGAEEPDEALSETDIVLLTALHVMSLCHYDELEELGAPTLKDAGYYGADGFQVTICHVETEAQDLDGAFGRGSQQSLYCFGIKTHQAVELPHH